MSALVESMAFVGETPWHGLGVQVPDNITVEEMIKKAGLDWAVKLNDVYFHSKNDQGQDILVKDPHHKIMYRDDTNNVLDIVGKRYKPYQNKDVLQFFHQYVKAGSMKLETAGSLNYGKIIWGLAKMNSKFKIGSDDEVENYLLLANPHQYGHAMTVKYTPIRVVCNNTLTFAISSNSQENISLTHIYEFDDKLQNEVANCLGLANEKTNQFEKECNLMADIQLSKETAHDILSETFIDKKNDKIKERAVNFIMDLYNGQGKGSSLVAARGTGWGLFNAVTEFYDWHIGRTADVRLRNSWFGTTGNLKHKVKKDILGYAKAA